jgi:rhodanese-related sulfurtransferase
MPAGGARLDVFEADAYSVAGEIVLVDVREPQECEAGHPAGAVNVPLSGYPDAVRALPQLPLAFTCRTGRRSRLATELAIELGRTDVASMDGGFQAWTQAGLPVNETPWNTTLTGST